MKAKLIFDLNDPDDNRDHLCCVKAKGMALVLWELSHNARKKIERTLDETETPDSDTVLNLFYVTFYGLLEENGIIIDDLII